MAACLFLGCALRNSCSAVAMRNNHGTQKPSFGMLDCLTISLVLNNKNILKMQPFLFLTCKISRVSCRFFNGDAPFVVLNDLDFIEYVYVRNFQNFVDRGVSARFNFYCFSMQRSRHSLRLLIFVVQCIRNQIFSALLQLTHAVISNFHW